MAKLIYRNWSIWEQNGTQYSFKNGIYHVIIEKLQTQKVETGFNDPTKEKIFKDETSVEQQEEYDFPETRIDTTDPENPVTIKLTKPYVLQFLKKRINEMEAPKAITIIQPDGIVKSELDSINS